MAKVVTFIGVAAIAVGILFMAAGFVAGGSWLFLLSAQVALPAVISGIVFMAFGQVVDLLESIAASLRAANAAREQAERAKTGMPLMLSEIAAPVRALRSIGDASGSLSERQRSAILDFVGRCNGVELSKEQKQQVAAWIDATTAPLSDDLKSLQYLSAEMRRRFQATLGAMTNGSGITHMGAEQKAKVEAVVTQLLAALAPPASA